MRRIILLPFVIVGITFLIAAAVMLGIFRYQTADMVPVEGVIDGWEGDHPIIAYTMDGQACTATMSVSYHPHRPVGSPYRLMADPEQPGHAVDYFLVLMGSIFGGMAILLLAVGFIVWRVMGRRERLRDELRQYGLRVTTVITELQVNRSVQVNSRHPWVAVATCVHPTTREKVTVRSHLLWKPTVAAGDKVDVFFDPIHERRYAMDIPEEKR